mgnify:FL=1
MFWKSLLHFLIKQISKLIAVANEVFKKDFFLYAIKIKEKARNGKIVYRFG